jgi:hypothetical protein
MSTAKIARAVARYIEPSARGLAGCTNCTRMRMQPSLSGPRQPYCPRLGCWVKELAICDHYAAQPATPTQETQHEPA